MIDKDTFKWFVRGFILTILLLLVMVMVIRPTIGWAQGGDEEISNAESLVEMPPDVIITDPTVDLTEIIMAENELTAQEFITPLIIPAADFNDDGENNNYRFWPTTGYIRSTGAGGACLMAPVYLPDGKVIENFYVYLYDNSTDNFTVNLRRKQNKDTSSPDVLGGVTTSGTDTSVQILGDDTISSGTVDNRHYSYYVDTCFSSTSTSHRIYAVWVFYSEPT